MSDGISEARREERAIVQLRKALDEVNEALEEVYDCIWGVPSWVVPDINETLKPFRLRVVPEPCEESKEKRGT